jgi:tRNA(His) 5'-end guanylyltransferase
MELSERMKYYENLSQHRFSPLIPVIARLDGRSFHTFCKHMVKPHDEDFPYDDGVHHIAPRK